MGDQLLLFDDIERDYLGPAGYSEPRFHFFNQTAKPEFVYLRELFQRWFGDFDADPGKKNQLRGEFRSEDDKEHLSAFFEIYLYQRLC